MQIVYSQFVCYTYNDGIVEFLNKFTKNIDDRIGVKTKIVEKLQEYKKSLIYEVVTGKKEV